MEVKHWKGIGKIIVWFSRRRLYSVWFRRHWQPAFPFCSGKSWMRRQRSRRRCSGSCVYLRWFIFCWFVERAFSAQLRQNFLLGGSSGSTGGTCFGGSWAAGRPGIIRKIRRTIFPRWPMIWSSLKKIILSLCWTALNWSWCWRQRWSFLCFWAHWSRRFWWPHFCWCF